MDYLLYHLKADGPQTVREIEAWFLDQVPGVDERNVQGTVRDAIDVALRNYQITEDRGSGEPFYDLIHSI